MIVLDTSVLLEALRAEPAPRVLSWLSSRDEKDFVTTAITRAEILAGIATLPEGRRRTLLEETANHVFAESFSGRVLPFDDEAAIAYPAILEGRASTGRPMRALDGIVAAIARANGAAIATRDLRDFEGCGLTLHDPWKRA